MYVGVPTDPPPPPLSPAADCPTRRPPMCGSTKPPPPPPPTTPKTVAHPPGVTHCLGATPGAIRLRRCAPGPSWIGAALRYDAEDLPSGRKGLRVGSPMIKTSIDLPKIPLLPDPACYHYCKLLSPARAMEWLLVDGLRVYGGLSPPQPDHQPPAQYLS